MIRRVLIACIVLLSVAVLGCNVFADDREIGTAPLAVTWYFSFGYELESPYELSDGYGQAGWGDRSSGTILTKPAIGYYASGDENTIRWQLDRMMDAGISVVFLSWWGWGDHNLDGEVEGDIGQAYDGSIRTALQIIQEDDLPFEFAILVEDFWGVFGEIKTRDLMGDQKDMITDYLWKNYYEPFGDIVFRYFGDRPLLISTIGEPGPLWGHFDDPRFDLREVYWTLQAEQDGMWTPPTYREPPSVMPGPEGVVMLWPRKADDLSKIPWLISSTYDVDIYLTENVYDQGWKKILERELRPEIRLLWLWSWNSYNDLLYIEPDDGQNSLSHGDLLLEKTAYYYGLYQEGRGFIEY